MNASVAVVIPTHNHAHFLAAAIDSVLAQTVPPAEVIVVDDGSRDDPAKVTRHYPLVKLIQQSSQGVSAARNAGVAAAASEYLVFLDADDRLMPDAIAQNLEQFATYPECGMVYGAYAFVDAPTGKVTSEAFEAPGVDTFAGLLRNNCVGMLAAAMFRADAYRAVGGFDAKQRASEDYDLYLRIARRYHVVARSAVIAEYWQHGGNTSRDSAFMLGWVLEVLRGYRDDAKARPEWLAALRQGRANCIRFYSDRWIAGLRRGDIPLDSLVMQAVGITKVAPMGLPCGLLRALGWEVRLLVRRVRRELRGRRARSPGGAS